MKQFFAILFLALTTLFEAAAQTWIDGTVRDAQGPLVGVNVFVVGTLDGSISDSLGRFSFVTKQTGECVLRASMLGYEDVSIKADAARLWTSFCGKRSPRWTRWW